MSDLTLNAICRNLAELSEPVALAYRQSAVDLAVLGVLGQGDPKLAELCGTAATAAELIAAWLKANAHV